MALFRRRPLMVEAIQWTGSNVEAINRFLGGAPTFIGTVHVGDWIVRSPTGELYPIPAPIFQTTYEPIE